MARCATSSESTSVGCDDGIGLVSVGRPRRGARVTALKRIATATAGLAGIVLAVTLLPTPASSHHAYDLNCPDFSTQAAAQYHMNAHPGDPDGLDGNDNDGRACESNPCPCY